MDEKRGKPGNPNPETGRSSKVHDGPLICDEPWVQGEAFNSDADVLAFVISANLKRRHLNESQRAMVAAKLATLAKGANQHAQICAPSQQDAADLLSVSRRNVQHGRKVLEGGTPELVASVEAGDTAVSTAATLAELHQPLDLDELLQLPDREDLDRL